MEGNAEMEEIAKYRISVIYKYILLCVRCCPLPPPGAEMADERMDAATPVAEETQAEIPAPVKRMLLVLMG